MLNTRNRLTVHLVSILGAEAAVPLAISALVAIIALRRAAGVLQPGRKG